MTLLSAQNGIFRTLQIEVREHGKDWKRVRGDESMNEFMRTGMRYEVRVLNPEFVLGIGIDGTSVEVPERYLPVRD